MLKELVNEIIELLNEVEAKDNRISQFIERRWIIWYNYML